MIHVLEVDKGNCARCQELSGLVKDTKWEMEVLNTQLNTMDEIWSINHIMGDIWNLLIKLESYDL